MKQHDPRQQTPIRQAARSLSEAMLSMRDSTEMKAFLTDLCTPAELEAMVDRWRVAQLLDEGNTYREINAATEVSVTTIGRVARFIEHGEGGYRLALARRRDEQ